jgi:hypothetical protein
MEQSYFSQLDKQYKQYLQNLVFGKIFEAIVLRGGKNKPATSVELHKQIALFQKNEKKMEGSVGRSSGRIGQVKNLAIRNGRHRLLLQRKMIFCF